MSRHAQVMDAVLAKVSTALPGVTTRRGLLLLDQIPADQLPYAMAYNPTEQASPLDVGQQKGKALLTRYAVVQRFDADVPAQSRQDSALAVLDAVEASLETDPTLGGLVEGCSLSLRGLDEFPDTGRVVGYFELTSTEVK